MISALALVFFINVIFGEDTFGRFGRDIDFGADQMTVKPEDTFSDVSGDVFKYSGGARKSGEAVLLSDMLEIQNADGSTTRLTDAEGITVSLSDVKDTYQNSVLTKLGTQETEDLEEIPTAFVYDREQSLLYFYKSGVYDVYVTIYKDDRNGIRYVFSVPVEVNL